MANLSGLLITVRTGKQGAAMEKGKFTAEYEQEISTLTLNPEDLALLGLAEKEQAVLNSAVGKVFVTCRSAAGPRGVFFLPLGAVANQLIGEETFGTGVPEYKGIYVEIEPMPKSDSNKEGV